MRRIATVSFFIFVIVVFGIFLSGQSGAVLKLIGEAGRNFASVFFVDSRTVADLRTKYQSNDSQKKINILIVPGHEPHQGGTEYKDLKERDIAVDLALDLAGYLKTNPRYNVIISRGKDSWNPDIQSYFDNHWEDIKKFSQDEKDQMNLLIGQGKVIKVTDGVEHNTAPTNIALRIYGINKWSNEHDIDLAIHLHVNDYPRRKMTSAGAYSGFSIYVPDRQYSNARASTAIAQNIFKQLSSVNHVSNLPKEDAGIVEDQDLIAIGSHNSADAASILIEYGYIYEPQFANETVRAPYLQKAAYQTYLGIQDFFSAQANASLTRR